MFINKDKKRMQSNSFIAPVTSLILKPSRITVNASEVINLTCETNPCNPNATIRWHIKEKVVTDQSIIRTVDADGNNGYIKTTSILQYTGDEKDNLADVYCTAMNLPNNTAKSEVYILDVKCKHVFFK